MSKKNTKIVLILVAVFFLAACGIEDVPFLYPIESNIQTSAASSAVIRTPSENDPTFTHFAVFYRIYSSHISTLDVSRPNFSLIHAQLNADHNAVYPLTDITTFIPRNMHDFFVRQRNFHVLEVEGERHINAVLGNQNNILGTTIRFDFPSWRNPYMTIRGTEYTLIRAQEPTIEADNRFFRNIPQLHDHNPLDARINADVARIPPASLQAGAPINAYVAMYIVAVGMDGHSPVFSPPALIHVFRLPD